MLIVVIMTCLGYSLSHLRQCDAMSFVYHLPFMLCIVWQSTNSTWLLLSLSIIFLCFFYFSFLLKIWTWSEEAPTRRHHLLLLKDGRVFEVVSNRLSMLLVVMIFGCQLHLIFPVHGWPHLIRLSNDVESGKSAWVTFQEFLLGHTLRIQLSLVLNCGILLLWRLFWRILLHFATICKNSLNLRSHHQLVLLRLFRFFVSEKPKLAILKSYLCKSTALILMGRNLRRRIHLTSRISLSFCRFHQIIWILRNYGLWSVFKLMSQRIVHGLWRFLERWVGETGNDTCCSLGFLLWSEDTPAGQDRRSFCLGGDFWLKRRVLICFSCNYLDSFGCSMDLV